MNSIVKKYLLVLMSFLLLVSSAGCASVGDSEEDEDAPGSGPKSNIKSQSDIKTQSGKKTKTDGIESDFGRLVISGFELAEDDYYMKSKGGTDYLMLEQEAFKSAFRIPYIPNTYPGLDQDGNGGVSVVWNDANGILLKVDLKEGSSGAVVNGEEYDMGMAPVTKNGVLYIPSNIFITLLQMDEKYDRQLDTLFIERSEDFPNEILLGKWSDTDTNLLVGYKDLVTGAVELPSFAEAYAFDQDGSFRLVMVGVGGYQDTFIMQEGKYKVFGNTIAFYNIVETLYQGEPFQLVHEKKRLDDPDYEYITNYDPDEDRLEMTFWLNRAG